jgi:hypothetical protein
VRYWLYKCNAADGGPAGYFGDWRTEVFNRARPIGWGGHYSSNSPEVWKALDERAGVGDVVVAYQTDERSVVGFCLISSIRARPPGVELVLRPLALLPDGFEIHAAKKGTILEHSAAVNGPVMLRELSAPEMKVLVRLAGGPASVLRGQPVAGGYRSMRAR